MMVPVLAGYWGLNLETRELLLCPRSREMFGFMHGSRKRLASRDWEARIHPDDMPLIEGELAAAGRNNKVYAARFRTIRLDGSTCDVLGVGRPTARNPKQFVGLNFDLRDTAKIAERQSRTADAAMYYAVARSGLREPANENGSRPSLTFSLKSGTAQPRTKRRDLNSERRILAHRARVMFDGRQLRKMFLNPAIFGEVAFDLLLALYLPSSGSMMDAEALSERVGASLIVTIRWLRFLVSEGLVLTVGGPEADPAGALKAALTDKARVTLDEYFKTTVYLS